MQDDTSIQELKLEITPPCRLYPVTSLNASRYAPYDSSVACVQLHPQVINRGPTSRVSTSSVPKWRRLVQPEGQLYFVLSGEFAFDVVTEANIEDVQIQDRILNCIAVANEELDCHDIKLPPRCELFLELRADLVSCNYYFVDHVGKGLFWLEDVCTEFLNIPPAASASHIEMKQEQLYWVHVEFYPMHQESHEQQFSQLVDDLCNIISHGQGDRLTSSGSTFPFTADKCRQFLELLSRKRGQRVDGYTLCYAARLAGAIAYSRFGNFYGQRPAKLDRLQKVLYTDDVQHKWISTVANVLMWGIPRRYTKYLDDLYVNEYVYADQWTHFMSVCLADWTSSLSWSLAVFIASILLANVQGGTLYTSIPPVLACTLSIASASCLHLRHQPLAEPSLGADVGVRYLQFAKSSIVGFLPSSVAFSLPRASYLWGVGFLAAQFLFVAYESVDKVVALVAGSVIAAILIFMLYVIHPEDAASLFWSLTSFCIPRLYARNAEPMV